MPQNVSRNSTGNDELDLALIEKEIYGSIIAIIAYIVLIISANQDKEAILQKEMGKQSSSGSQSSQLAAISSFLTLITSTILGEVASIRLKEIENSIQTGTSTSSIVPNENINTGYEISIIGNVLKAIGAFQRANEQAQGTIL